MSEQAHIIDIERIVLNGVGHLPPMEVRALVEREVRRALQGTELSALKGTGTNEGNVATAVGRSVERSITGGPAMRNPR